MYGCYSVQPFSKIHHREFTFGERGEGNVLGGFRSEASHLAYG